MFRDSKGSTALLTLTAGHTMADLYIGILAAVAPGISIFLDIPLGDLIVLIGLGSLASNVASPVAGYVMLRKNVAWTLGFAVLLSALPVGMGFVSGYRSLAFLVIAGGFGTGFFHPEGALAANDASGDKAYLGVPLFMAGGAIGYAAGTMASIRIGEDLGYPALALLLIPGLAVAAFLAAQYRQLKRAHPSVVMRPRSKRLAAVRVGCLSFWPLFLESTLMLLANGIYLNLMTSHYELVFGSGVRAVAGWIILLTSLIGAFASFAWSALARSRGFFQTALLTQSLAFPLFIAMAFPASPLAGLLIAIPLSLIAPTAVYPITVALARNATGLTQSVRTALVMGGAGLISAFGVIAAGVLLRAGWASEHLILSAAACSLGVVLIAAWQLFRSRNDKARIPA